MSDVEGHTYTVHFQFSARDDAHARLIAEKMNSLIEDWHDAIDVEQDEPLMIEPQGYVVEAAHLTDADDWAEHVGWEDACSMCGRSGTGRSRSGRGARVCPACIERGRLSTYRIEDVRI